MTIEVLKRKKEQKSFLLFEFFQVNKKQVLKKECHENLFFQEKTFCSCVKPTKLFVEFVKKKNLISVHLGN